MQAKAITATSKRRSPGDGAVFYSAAKKRWIVRVVDREGRRTTRETKTEPEARAKLQDLQDRLRTGGDYVPVRPKPTPKRGRPPGPPGSRRARMTLTTRIAVLVRDGLRCRLCGRGADDGIQLEIDHVHPQSKGGPGTLDNLQVLCFDCNRGKRDRLLPDEKRVQARVGKPGI